MPKCALLVRKVSANLDYILSGSRHAGLLPVTSSIFSFAFNSDTVSRLNILGNPHPLRLVVRPLHKINPTAFARPGSSLLCGAPYVVGSGRC